ncbi:MAG: cadherin-like beta sandwich domain-containing protein [Bacilli bacterium]|nr:cadherin-like beta sandwich domain-containing protein [Bacilli bacterium]
MKKKILLLIALIGIILLPKEVYAFSSNLYCSPGNKTVTVGESFTVTISGSASEATDWISAGTVYYSSNLRLTSDSGDRLDYDDVASFSKNYTFTALSEGTATINQKFSVTNQDDFSSPTKTSSNCTITIVKATSSNTNTSRPSTNNNNNRKPDPNKSSNNNLKSISIEGVELNPEFNKDTLEYSAIVPGSTEKITVNAEAEDGKSNIDGLGEKELQEGLNEISLYVTAENGDVKEYKLNITREEKNPIVVTIDGKKYTVVKKETEMELPEGYTKETIMIGEEEVTVYTNEKVGRTLVVLIDEEGNKGFYIYDSKKETYTEFKEFDSKKIKILIINTPEEEIPFGFKKITFTINGQKVNGYYYKTSDKFRLVYGVDLDNGDEGFYQYDMKQKTFQRYYGKQLKEYTKYGKYALYCAGGLVLLVLILFISTISLLIKNKKLKKNGNVEIKEEKKKKEVKEEVKPKEEVKEEPKVLTRAERLRLKEEAARELARNEETEEDEEIMEPSKRELRKQAKEKKKEEKRLAKEAKLKEKEVLKEEPKESKTEEIEKTEELDKKELKRLQKEKERKLKEEADEFLR